MAYNFGFPYYNGYQQQFQQIQPLQQNQTNSGDGRIWVQGEVGAKAYLVAPGNTVPLWDSEQQVIYLKSVMPNGVPSMTKLIYSMDNPTPAPAPVNPDYITRSEFEKRISELIKTEVNSNE